MNVDIDNYHQIRSYIAENGLIEKVLSWMPYSQSQFICIDLEFSGVEFDNNEKVKYDMFLHERYQKMASVASKFNIVQVGITFLVPTRQKQGQFHTAYPFNFYVFPRQSPTSNPTISMQSGCIQFNSKHGMDWNRWIRKGITYVRMSQMHKSLQNISNSNSNLNFYNSVTVTNASSNGNLLNVKLYGEMLGQLSQNVRKYVEDIVNTLKGKQVGFRHVVQVPGFCVNVIRKTIQLWANQYSKNLMIMKTKVASESDSDQQLTTISKTLSAQISQPSSQTSNMVNLQIEIISQERKKKQEQKQKQHFLGFTLIFQQIWNSNKTIIGHNFLFDLLFLYSSFIDELPRDYQNFKKMLSDFNCQSQKIQQPQKKSSQVIQQTQQKKVLKSCNLGRKFYDTKYIASQSQLKQKIFKKGTSLEQLYKYYKQKPNNTKIKLAPGFQTYDLNKPALHEAGFDSYLTAWVFLHLPFNKQNEGTISIHKSYFNMNIRSPVDQIRSDLKVFVIAIVLNNAYVPYEQLRVMRINMGKTIRDELQNQKIMNNVVVIDGFKEIFISAKEIQKTSLVIQFLIRLKKQKIVNINNVMSLEAWIKMRAEALALTVNANKTNKT